MKNRINNLYGLNHVLSNWDLSMDPKKAFPNSNLNQIIANGSIHIYVPITTSISEKAQDSQTNLIFYQVSLKCKCILLGDLLYEIYNFYNKTLVKTEDLTFVSVAPTMSYFTNIHLMEHSKNKKHLKTLRFIDFLHLQNKVDKITQGSNNVYVLFTKRS